MDENRNSPVRGRRDAVKAEEMDKLVAKGIRAMENGHIHLALVCFERASEEARNPTINSGLGFCIAEARGELARGEHLCREAIVLDPDNTFHYRNLGSVLLLKGNKDEAITVFREGLRVRRDEGIIARLDALGTRKPPVLGSLGRDHFLNRLVGIMLTRLGFR